MIVIVCGIPGSGKTTLATRLQRRLADRGYTFELRHSDDYARRTYDRMYEDVAEAKEAGRGDGWILDGTFFKREWRNRFYQLDDTYEVWVKASLETCLARNRARADPISERGVESIFRKFEPPRADLELDTGALSVQAALDRFEAVVIDWIEN